MSDKWRQAIPVVLSVLGVVGLGVTVYSAINEKDEAEKLVKEAKKKEDFSAKDEIVANVKGYKKTIAFGAGTTFCIIGSCALNKSNQAKISAVAAAYPLLERSYTEYKDKVKDILGLEAHQQVVDSIAKDKVERTPKHLSSPGIFAASTLDVGEDLLEPEVTRTFYDTYSQRYFESTLQDVIQAEYHLNRKFVLGKPVNVNEWYEFLGIPEIDCGDKHWFLCDEVYWIDFDHHTVTLDDGLEVIVIDFLYDPIFTQEECDNM